AHLGRIMQIFPHSEVFREDGIMSGYRHPRSSALDCILSSFQMTNETVNIWTHFLPTWYFLWRFSVLCSSLDFLMDSYTWPLLVYMLLICLYPFTSSCAHTFSTMSAEARHICYFFDYGALSLYSLGTLRFSRPILSLRVHFSVFCNRFVELQFPHKSKILRTAAFVVPFLFDSFPLFYRLLSCCWGSCSPSQALASHSYHLFFAFLTCFLFASHLPERLAPGRFDYIGSIRVLLLQDVQIDGRVLDEGHEPVVDVLNDKPLLRFSLPAALHEEMHFLRAGAWPFKLSPLCDALNGLERG
uniref:Progestin and adipoQ receptor family member 6 n=1 Tax=Sinocyclocheilus grahami TaxID=75366 RepID=A0A672S5U5_SINGR